MTCICTGCWVYDPVHRRGMYGDLHRVGLSLVLNGPSQGKWVYRDTPAQNERAFIVDNDSDALFERRGVIAIGGGMPTRALVDHIAPYEERAISIFKAMNVSGAPAIWEMS